MSFFLLFAIAIEAFYCYVVNGSLLFQKSKKGVKHDRV